ncbi:MAG: hypothetical protein MJB14_19005 [Spirochaetes bacterium]|nr:hypothetical protein [Spirochaetota bacterium]
MGYLKDDILHLRNDIEHMHEDISLLKSKLEESDFDVAILNDIVNRLSDFEIHLQHVLQHIIHVEEQVKGF